MSRCRETNKNKGGEISTKYHRLNTAKCYKKINSEYAIEYTKHVKDVY